MNRIEIEKLLYRYHNGVCTDEELEILQAQIFNAGNKPILTESEINLVKDEMRVKLHELVNPVEAKRIKLWPWTGIAAAMVLIILSVWLFISPRHPQGMAAGSVYANDIAPGKHTATLSVNGKLLQLSDARTGIIIDNDKLIYNDGSSVDSNNVGSKPTMLTLVTPRGGMYQTTLSDGTRVWLNADSKLEFLSNFRNAANRIVKLTGEAYFEVAKMQMSSRTNSRDLKPVPFIVESNEQRVTVLGTHFNISAYKNEGAKTTLLEGSVRVAPLFSNGGEVGTTERVLKPNQQSLITASDKIAVKDVDASYAILWKEGKFNFKSEELGAIMRKVQRWYNIEVIFNQDVSDIVVTGSVSRFSNLSTLLNKLEQTGGIKFKIEGRKVYVEK